ncbi:DUF922 domain-containing protein [Emticicia sp. 17c]|uniref:DUF922 domain-containing protein n=1 Tax=Emticicia sp. 17c TaxID=3127704 RepID=UPI00301D2D0A
MVVTKIYQTGNSLTQDVIIMEPDDILPQEATLLASIRFGDKGASINCDYESAKDAITKQAIKCGGNLIKITSLKLPDNWSTCCRIEALVYHTPDNRKFEKIIYWSDTRKLIYSDFKSKVKPLESFHPITIATTGAGILYRASKITPFTFLIKECYIKSYFDCRKSWFDKNFENPEVLEHEQLHFDITELFARRLRKKLINEYITPITLETLEKEIKQTMSDLEKLQQKYDQEAGHGIDDEIQKKWRKLIAEELKKLNIYQSDLVVFKKNK